MKKFFKLIVVLLIFFFAGKYFISYSLKPTYEGTKSISSLTTEVTVYYDDYGIPHIYADNELDAQRALGYAHAQDRLWQMELLRRIAPGKLSEIFGDKALQNDLFFASLGIEEASIKTIKNLDKNSKAYKLGEAYLEGVNEFIESGNTPIEFYILGIDKTKFTLKDSYNIFGYMAFSFAAAHKTDPVLSSIQAKYGNEYIKELGIDVDPNSVLIHNYNKANEEIATTVATILKNSPVPAFIGSNSWIVSPKKTKNGKVLFANDPHISFSATSVWYEAHINTPTYESYGYYLGGIPFPVLSHNRNFAYGLTMFENDDIDFYQEENHPNDASKYKIVDGYQSYTSVEKTIKVKGADDVKITVKSTQHGPIMNTVVNTLSDRPIAMSWVYTKLKNKILDAMYHVSHAKNKSEFEKGVTMVHAPGLNFMYGDAQDNIAWYAAAKLYKLPKNVSSKFILDGTNGKNEITEYLDFSQNPQAKNPPWNYVYSANNQPDSIAGMLYPGYYLPKDRAKRIVNLLEPKNDWAKEDYKKMLLDSKSSMAGELSKIIVKNTDQNLTSKNEKEALKILENWDGNFVKSSTGATIYTKFIYFFLKNTFEDEIGEKTFASFIDTHLMLRAINNQLERENSVWFDNINTTDIKENKSQIITKSLSEAIASLEKQLGNNVNSWTWNRVHKLTHYHPIGVEVPLFDYLFNFNVGTYEVDGGNEVINNLMYNKTDDKINDIIAGPSTRRIIDFSDVENSVSILPTGNSGNPFSKHYRDQAQLYADGKFRKMKLNKEEIERVSTKLILKPKK